METQEQEKLVGGRLVRRMEPAEPAMGGGRLFTRMPDGVVVEAPDEETLAVVLRGYATWAAVAA